MAAKRKKKTGRPPKINDQLIALAEALLARRHTKAEVKRLLKAAHERAAKATATDQYLSARTCEKILTAARTSLADRIGKARGDLRNEAYLFYDSVLRDPGAKPLEKIKAQERIDKLLGLEKPQRIALKGNVNHGGAVKMDLSALSLDELKSLERIAERVTEPAAGPGTHPGGAGPARPA